MDIKLGDIQTTALIPLTIKANETMRRKPRIRDEKAVEIIETLGVDTAQYDKFLSHEGVVARTIMLDRKLADIISKFPDSVIVSIAAGFDSRFARLDNGRIRWFDLGLPDAIEVRKKVFPEQDRVTMIAGNALDPAWCGPVREALKESTAKPVFSRKGCSCMVPGRRSVRRSVCDRKHHNRTNGWYGNGCCHSTDRSDDRRTSG